MLLHDWLVLTAAANAQTHRLPLQANLISYATSKNQRLTFHGTS